MRSTDSEHRARPWRVHSLASDFKLLDVWTFELDEKPASLDAFLDVFWRAGRRVGDGRLARARVWIGRKLRWDDHDLTLPIPGCREVSVRERLDDEDRARNRAAPDAPSPFPTPELRTVYRFADEALYEFSNDTIHGLLHVALAEAPTLAVYTKSRGVASDLYMAAISPFRHLFVYPTLMKRVRETAAGR